MLTLSEAIERLYAHDELAAKSFEDLLRMLEKDIKIAKYNLLTDVITILGAYEDVSTNEEDS